MQYAAHLIRIDRATGHQQLHRRRCVKADTARTAAAQAAQLFMPHVYTSAPGIGWHINVTPIH